MPVAGDPKENHLLAALPAASYERLRSHLMYRRLALGESIYESGDCISNVLFLTTSIVSLLNTTSGGSSAEISIVGNEGVVGIALFMGGHSMPSRAVVQSAGDAFRVSSEVIQDEFNRSGAMQHLLLKYTQALITQMAQTALCNRHHSLHQQLCRWLLLSLDRLAGNELVMTQELIANMLGVRREGVATAAKKLQGTGIIDYRRGHIKVLDRVGLEACTCECYAVVKREYNRLLPSSGLD